MKKLLFLVPLFGVVGLAAAVLESPVRAGTDKDDGEKGEQQISFKDLPGPIKRALKDLKVGQVSEIEREKTKSGATVYEVELRVGKHEVELTLSSDGKLLGVEIEEDDDDDGKKRKKKGKKKRKKDRDDD